MANKAFEIQNSTLKIGGVELQAGTTGVVIPGVTQATNYKAEEVNDTGDQTYNGFPPNSEGDVAVIDAALYAVLVANGDTRFFASYFVKIDGEGYIDEITVGSVGSYSQANADLAESTDLYAYIGSGSAGDIPLVPQDWIQVPFRVRMRAGEIETIGSGGGGTGTINQIYSQLNDGYVIVAVDTNDNIVWVSGNIITDLENSDYLNVNSGPPQFRVRIEDWNYEPSPNQTGIWLNSNDIEVSQALVDNGSKVLLFKLIDQPTTLILDPNFNAFEVNGVVALTSGGSGSGINFDADYAINLQGEGVIRNTTDSGNANLVAINYSQLQWTTPPGAAEASPNDTQEPKNWAYVDELGFSIETNINAVNNLGSNYWQFNNSGGIVFPDGSVQTTAYVGSGTIVTNLWVACGNNPGGAMAVSSTDGANWTTHDYNTVLPNVNFNKLAISEDKIVYIGYDNISASDGLYYASAPEDVPILAAGTNVFPNSQNTVNWNEINYLGGKFIATGSYTTTAIVPANITSAVLAVDANRTTAVVTLSNNNFDFNGVHVTISGASNSELNGNFQLSYNSLDAPYSGIFEIYNLDGSPITLTSTDVTGATLVTTNLENLNWPTFIYSTNGVDWTYGDVDPGYYDAVLGSYPRCSMSDVAYNGTGYLIPVTDGRFSNLQDTPTVSGPGAFYITDITAFVGGPQFIVGDQIPQGLPGTFNNIASYGDGTFFVSDDLYNVWTAADPTGVWTSHNILASLTSLFGYTGGNDGVGGDIDSAVCGTVNSQEMFVATTNQGAVIYTTDNGVTFQGSVPDPYISTATVSLTGSSTVIAITGETPFPGEKITITVANGDDTNWNGTYTVTAWTNPNEYQLFDINGVAIVSDGFITPNNPLTVILSHGRDLDAIHVADGACVVFSHDSYKLYRSTDMVNWSTVFTNQFYSIGDIYYAGRPVTGLPIGIANGENSLTIDSYGNITLDNTTEGAHDRGLFWAWGSKNGGTDAGLYHDEDGITLQSFSDDGVWANGSPVNLVTNPGPTQNKWSFKPDGRLVFPDNTKQTTAYVHRNINLDGGGAAVHFEQEVGYIDGGFSATRHGVADPTFDGGDRLTESNQYNINGGGA